MSVVQRKRIKSIGNISYSDYYNSLLCSECTISTKQCHYKHLFDNYDDKINLLVEYDNYKLYGFPKLYNTCINGIIGPSKSGKSLLLSILAKQIPMKGNNRNSENDIVKSDYMANMYFGEMSIIKKDQKIKSFRSHHYNNLVINYLYTKGFSKMTILRNNYDIIEDILHKDLSILSLDELQLLYMWRTCNVLRDTYIFDEPFKYLDIWQKHKVAKMIMKLKDNNHYIIITDNDITFMDYLCDNLIIIDNAHNGENIILNTTSISNAKNININSPKFYIPRYKKYDELNNGNHILHYKKEELDNIIVNKGYFSLYCSINIILGKSTSGKTFFLYWIMNKFPKYTYSIKQQNLKCPWYVGTVLDVLRKKINNKLSQLMFITNVIRPLKINLLFDKQCKALTFQEKQLVEIAICLGTFADIYIIDSLSRHLDYRFRLIVSNVIKKFIKKYRKSLFVVDDDILVCTTLSHDTNTALFRTKVNNNNITISSPTYFNHYFHKKFNVIFYDTECGRAMIKPMRRNSIL